jgi:hypothetical protein
MNRIALIALLAAACASPAIAAEKAGDAPKKDGENAAFAALPENIRKVANKQIQDGKVTAVEEIKQGKKTSYDISFTGKDGKPHKIEVTEGGSVINKDEKKNEPGKPPVQK